MSRYGNEPDYQVHSDSEVERSPLARFRSEAIKCQHTISAGNIEFLREL
jgi:hypothetical protein